MTERAARSTRIHSIAWFAVIAVIGLMGVVRFVGLGGSPPGFYTDEGAIGAHVLCLAHSGHDADGRPWPLFSASSGGGYTSPTHLYPAALWVRCFGGSIVVLRAYAAFTMTIAIAGLFFLGKLLIGSTRGGAYVVLAASVSPFFFQFSRVAVDDPATFLLGLIWGMYFFLRSPRLFDGIVSAVFLSVAAYAYPSARVVLPLLFVLLLWMKAARREVRAGGVLAFLVTGFVLCLPLLVQTVSGKLMARYEVVGLFASGYRHAHQLDGPRVWLVFLKNCLLHFGPRYLFVEGDSNLRHNPGFSGQLSWLDSAALALGLAYLIVTWRQKRDGPGAARILAFCVIGYAIGVLPAAVTWEGLPHALRSAASWPFVAILTGWIMARLAARWTWATPVLAGVAVVFAVRFLAYYLAVYPTLAGPAFQSRVRTAAESSRVSGDWNQFLSTARANAYDERAARYFLMQYGRMDCQSAAAAAARLLR